MSQTNFYGRISSADIEAVRELLQAWLGVDGFQETLKLSGDQLVYEADATYVYCYAADGGSYFLLEGHRDTGLDETRLWLQRLCEACAARRVSAALEYVAVDQAGQEISEQHSLSAET